MADNDRIAQQLIDGLTAEQLAGLVARFLDRYSDSEQAAFCDTLAPDVAAVLRRLLAPPPPTAGAAPASDGMSDAKFAAQFHAALGALQDVLSELGDEDGQYIQQEHEWEAPDFDAGRLAQDIERGAQSLLPLLERATALDLEDEDLFAEFCREISDSIGQYPEHIYTEDGVGFGPAATACVLSWIDLHADVEAAYLDKLVAFLERAGSVKLDPKAICTYLLDGWSEARRRRLYRAVEERRTAVAAFRQVTDTPHTLWHDLRYALATAFDTATGTEIAEASLHHDWSKGVELVDAAVDAGNVPRAVEFCRKTLDAYYQRRSFGRTDVRFDPATTPLFSFGDPAGEALRVVRVLGVWADLSAQAGDQNLAGLLGVQQALYSRASDWSAVREAFAHADRTATTALFRAWKDHTLQSQHGGGAGGTLRTAPVWPEWLIEAGFAGRFGAFTDKARAWLGQAAGTAGSSTRGAPWRASGDAWPPQMSLVAELLILAPPAANLPTLRLMLAQHCRLDPCSARLEWLGQTDVASLTAAGIGFVQRNMARLIPSPEIMGSDYEAAAGWLAVAREVAPTVARTTLEQWQIDHRRRPNLWRDLRQHGFAV